MPGANFPVQFGQVKRVVPACQGCTKIPPHCCGSSIGVSQIQPPGICPHSRSQGEVLWRVGVLLHTE